MRNLSIRARAMQSISLGDNDSLTIWRHIESMLQAPKSLAADIDLDADGLIVMRAALRDFKVSMRKPVEHPRRAEMLDMLADARARIDRINGKL